MTIDELRVWYPKLYREIYNLGVNTERRRTLAADLIADASPHEIHPAVFPLAAVKTHQEPNSCAPVG